MYTLDNESVNVVSDSDRSQIHKNRVTKEPKKNKTKHSAHFWRKWNF